MNIEIPIDKLPKVLPVCDEEGTLSMVMPRKTDTTLPKLDQYNFREHHKVDAFTFKTYYDELPEMRVCYLKIGHVEVTDDIFDTQFCDFCQNMCGEWHLSCHECDDAVICHACAAKDPPVCAHTAQWRPVAIYSTAYHSCDICHADFRHIVMMNHAMHYEHDLCQDCLDSAAGQELMRQTQHPAGYQVWFPEQFAGNMCDLYSFVPLLTSDDGGHMILYNINQESPYYHHTLLLIVDGHARMGFVKLDAEWTLDKLFNRVLELEQLNDHTRLCPILDIAQDLRIPIYYG